MEKTFFLPSVATIPRGVRIDYKLECSCSNSCEKVLELLFASDDKIAFENIQLTFNLPLSSKKISEELKISYDRIRNIYFSILQNRRLSLPERLLFLGKAMQILSSSNDALTDWEFLEENISSDSLDVQNNFSYSLPIQEKILLCFLKYSPSIQSYANKALDYFNIDDKTDQYIKASLHLKDLFPSEEVMFEKTIINHLFFEQFPFSKNKNNFFESFKALCGVYLFIRYLVVGYMADKTSLNDFIDVMAAAFRLIDHTDFDKNIGIILQQEGVTTIEQLAVLIKA